MSFPDTRRAIEDTFGDAWALAQPAVPVFYDNVKRPARAGNPSLEWVALSIREGRGQQSTSGALARHTIPGVVVVQVFTALNEGTQRGLVLAEAAALILRRRTVAHGSSGSITLRTPSVDIVGDGEGWWQTNLTVPYHRSVHF